MSKTDNPSNPVIECLEAARDLIAAPNGWTQDAYGRKTTGEKVCPDEIEKGSCFCPHGAIIRACPSPWGDIRREAMEALARATGETPVFGLAETVWVWNDHPGRTQAEVVAAFDRAIAAERAEAGDA